MLNIFRTVLIASVTLISATTWAETKLAVLNYQTVLFESLAAEDATNQLREMLGGAQGRVKELEQGIETRVNRLQTEEGLLTEEETETFKQEIVAFQQEVQSINLQIQQAQQQSRNEYVQYYQPRIRAIVEEYVAAEQYDLVLEAQTVVWNASVPDITQPILEKFDQIFTESRTQVQVDGE